MAIEDVPTDDRPKSEPLHGLTGFVHIPLADDPGRCDECNRIARTQPPWANGRKG